MNDKNELVPNCSEKSMKEASESSLRWIAKNEDAVNLWIILRNENEPEFIRFLSTLEHTINAGKAKNMKVWEFDLADMNLSTLEKEYNGRELQFGICDIINKQGVFDLVANPGGFESSKKAFNGHFHYTVFSLYRSGFMAHVAVFYSMIMTTPGFEQLETKAVSFQKLINAALDLDYRLFYLYDRGRAKYFTPDKMLSKLVMPPVSKTKNANANFAARSLKSCVNLEYDMQRKVFAQAKPDTWRPIKCNIVVISWNVAGYSPTEPADVSGIAACFDKDNMPDVIAIGLQEVVELKSSNLTKFFTNNAKENDVWVKCLHDTIKTLDPDYEVLGYQRMVGLFSVTMIHKKFMNQHFFHGIKEVKTGFMGIVGNKGSVITSMMIGDSLIHFCNTHLPSGDHVSKRASCIEDLYSEFCAGGKCDAFFLFGDLNTRVQMDLLSYKNVMHDFKITNPEIDFKSMMDKDEVKMGLHPCLNDNFHEADLPKAPTYRFVKNSNVFSEERVASW